MSCTVPGNILYTVPVPAGTVVYGYDLRYQGALITTYMAPYMGFLWGGVAGASLYALSTYAPSALLPYWATASLRRKVRAMSADERGLYFSYFASTAHACFQVAGSAHVALASPFHLAAPVAHFDTRMFDRMA